MHGGWIIQGYMPLMSNDTYGTLDSTRFHWCAKDEPPKPRRFFIACAQRVGADWLEIASSDETSFICRLRGLLLVA
jgi:hypothetical protein